jgi:hypothetical protein
MLPTFDHAIAEIQVVGPPRERWTEYCHRLCSGLDPSIAAALVAGYRAEDITELRQALLAAAPAGLPTLGIYLGLDTLNSDIGNNLEIGFHRSPDGDDPYAEWVYDDLEYAENHLIRGLVEMGRFYSALADESLAAGLDYAIHFAYGALVAGEALKDWNRSASLAVGFGFHDGDLLRLVHQDGSSRTFNCRFDFQDE